MIKFKESGSTWYLGQLKSYLTVTHWGWGKIDAILQMTLSNAFSWMEMIKNSPKFDPKGPINNILALMLTRR